MYLCLFGWHEHRIYEFVNKSCEFVCSNQTPMESYSQKKILYMGKHINRRKKPSSAEDEWAHITNLGDEEEGNELGDDVSSKMDIQDAMDVQDRSITFGNEYSEPSTNYEIYEEEKEKVKDDVGNTAQYLKFVNESIKEKRERIDNFHKKQQKFEDDILALQGDQPKSRETLNKIKYKDIKVNDIERTLHFLEKDRDEVKRKMEHHATQVSHAQMDILEKDKQIAEIKAEMEIVKRREQIHKEMERKNDPVETLKHKLKTVADDEKSSEVLEAVSSLVKTLKNSNSSADIETILKSQLGHFFFPSLYEFVLVFSQFPFLL